MPDPPLRKPAEFRHIFALREGGEIIVPHHDARRTLDRRADHLPPEVVWEVKLPSGAIRRLWPEEILTWEQQQL